MSHKIEKKYKSQLKKIWRLVNEYQGSDYSDHTKLLKKELQASNKTTTVLCRAYALAICAIKDTQNIVLHDVQVLAAIAMNHGLLVDMKTGEGKTLAAVLPLYLNALTGNSVVLATENEYLAMRDGKQMSQIFNLLGMRVSVSNGKNTQEKVNEYGLITNDYTADVIYTTHATMVFDYLFDNIRKTTQSKYLSKLYYVILDEADSVLLDQSQSPLVVSGAPTIQSSLYDICQHFVDMLDKDTDIDMDYDDQQCWLTDLGNLKANMFFKKNNIYQHKYYEINRYISLALRANFLLLEDEHYIVRNGEIFLLDTNTGRVMINTKLNGGLHQALETKEHVKRSEPTKALASITYKGFLSLFDKVSGMSGSADIDKKDIKEVYGIDTICVPTNKPVIREDRKEACFIYKNKMFSYLEHLIYGYHKETRPVLAIMESIEDCTKISQSLIKLGISHNVLNAHSLSKEAKIIAKAGQHGAVTVATSLVGRGTDIKLDKEAKLAGGLAVIIVGKPFNKRIEIQARGRSGRQGDPGITHLLVSLEDDIVDKYSNIDIKKIPNSKFADSEYIVHEVNRSQSICEEKVKESRETSIELDMNMQLCRSKVYSFRQEIMDCDIFNPNTLFEWSDKNKYEKLKQIYEKKLNELKTTANIKKYFMLCALNALDEKWIDTVDCMEQLRLVVGMRSVAQRNMKYEFRNEAALLYDKIFKDFKKQAVINFCETDVRLNSDGELWFTT